MNFSKLNLKFITTISKMTGYLINANEIRKNLKREAVIYSIACYDSSMKYIGETPGKLNK